MTDLEPHITSKMHCKKVVREVNKCRDRKDHLEGMIEEMRVTLVDILKLSEKMTEDIPRIKEKMRKAIQSMDDVKAKCQNDQNNHSWARFKFASLCVVGALASVCGGIFAGAVVKVAAAAGGVMAGAATAAGGVGVVGAAGAGSAAAGYKAYQDHKKTLELSDYLEQLEETIKAMDKAQGLVQKRETQWLGLVLDPAKHAETDQGQLGKRVSKLPSAKEDKKRFQKDLKGSEETLQRFDEGMTFLKESANTILEVLHE